MLLFDFQEFLLNKKTKEKMSAEDNYSMNLRSGLKRKSSESEKPSKKLKTAKNSSDNTRITHKRSIETVENQENVSPYRKKLRSQNKPKIPAQSKKNLFIIIISELFDC